MSLLSKLRNKMKEDKVKEFSNRSPVIKHKKSTITILTSLCVALTLAVSVVASTACTKTPTTPIDPNNPTIVDPNNPDPTKPDPNKPDPTDEYCDIINDIVSSDYYRNIVSSKSTFNSLIHSTVYSTHPYGFLGKHGHDVQAIKNGNLECETLPYIVGEDTNHLYVDTRVETKSGSLDYYTFYSLKYTVSNKEYSDFYELSNKSCVEAAFFVQELSTQRTPTVLSEASMLKSIYQTMHTSVNDVDKKYFVDVFDTNSVTFSLISFDLDKQTFQYKFTGRNSNNVISKSEYRTTNLICNYAQKITCVDGTNIMKTPNYALFDTEETWLNYKNNPVSITGFELQHNTLYRTTELYKDLNLQK